MIVIEEIDEEYPVYDFTVEDNHNFFANGILVHNCTEILENTEASPTGAGTYFNCFLSSVNLAEMVVPSTPPTIDFSLLEVVITSLVRSLDNANTLNFYPIEGVRKGAEDYRSIGIGMMGLQDMLFKMRIPFDSDRAVKIIDLITEYISFFTIKASMELSKERGPYPKYPGSSWEKEIFPFDTLSILEKNRGQSLSVNKLSVLNADMDKDSVFSNDETWPWLKDQVRRYGIRNGYLMSPAPNASISLYFGIYPSIEPQYANIYAKDNMLGKFIIINEYLMKDLQKLGLWSKDILETIKKENGSIQNIPEIPDELKLLYRGAFEIDPMAQVEHAKVMSKWIDQSHSRNIFVETASGKLLNNIYQECWQGGVKTTYYLRTKAATSIEKTTI